MRVPLFTVGKVSEHGVAIMPDALRWPGEVPIVDYRYGGRRVIGRATDLQIDEDGAVTVDVDIALAPPYSLGVAMDNARSHATADVPMVVTDGDLEEVTVSSGWEGFKVEPEERMAVEVKRPRLMCPECRQGKPDNCDGMALDPVTDDLVPCEGPG